MPDNEEQMEDQNIVYDEEGDSGEPLKKIEKLKKQLKDCREEKDKNLAGWQRAQADFINYRRRQEEQASEWSKMFGEGLIRDILPVLDSLDAAILARPDDQGLLTLKSQLKSVLKKHGLEEMKAIGEKFDPLFHEVIDFEGGGSDHGGEIVSGEIQKGYMLNGKVLRVAKVRVKK